MIEFTLAEQIYAFVKSVMMIKESQIYRFFRDWDKEEIAYYLQRLTTEHYLFKHGDDLISFANILPAPLTAYDARIDALEVLCQFSSREVLWITTNDYPMELSFGTVSEKAFCVATYTNNWQIKYALTTSARAKHTPPGDVNLMNYIAVVRDMDIMSKISVLDFYLYVMINPDGTVDNYEPPEE